jgi:XTP/dITP diphosphohydrolase
MARHFDDKTLLLASHNEHKAQELRALLKPQGITILTARDVNLPGLEEGEDSFLENALSKARAAMIATHLPALADDSGLVVSALDGAPGVRSARWAQEMGGYAQAFAKMQEAVIARGDASAAFECALALYWPDRHYETSVGRVEGHLVFPPRGAQGFGYDPIFCPQGYNCVFAEMKPQEKEAISHRGKAMADLLNRCFNSMIRA